LRKELEKEFDQLREVIQRRWFYSQACNHAISVLEKPFRVNCDGSYSTWAAEFAIQFGKGKLDHRWPSEWAGVREIAAKQFVEQLSGTCLVAVEVLAGGQPRNRASDRFMHIASMGKFARSAEHGGNFMQHPPGLLLCRPGRERFDLQCRSSEGFQEKSSNSQIFQMIDNPCVLTGGNVHDCRNQQTLAGSVSFRDLSHHCFK